MMPGLAPGSTPIAARFTVLLVDDEDDLRATVRRALASAEVRIVEATSGEEALAIAVACALTCDDVAATLWRAARHSGDSDSTAAICGNLLGAERGLDSLPAAWVAQVELREVIDDLAAQLSRD